MVSRTYSSPPALQRMFLDDSSEASFTIDKIDDPVKNAVTNMRRLQRAHSNSSCSNNPAATPKVADRTTTPLSLSAVALARITRKPRGNDTSTKHKLEKPGQKEEPSPSSPSLLSQQQHTIVARTTTTKRQKPRYQSGPAVSNIHNSHDLKNSSPTVPRLIRDTSFNVIRQKTLERKLIELQLVSSQ